MQNYLIIILIAMILVSLSIFIIAKITKRRIGMITTVLFLGGCLCLLAGAYLFPASSWRNISIGLFVIAAMIIGVSLWRLFRQNK